MAHGQTVYHSLNNKHSTKNRTSKKKKQKKEKKFIKKNKKQKKTEADVSMLSRQFEGFVGIARRLCSFRR